MDQFLLTHSFVVFQARWRPWRLFYFLGVALYMPHGKMILCAVQTHILSGRIGSYTIFRSCFEPADLSFIDPFPYVQPLIFRVLHCGSPCPRFGLCVHFSNTTVHFFSILSRIPFLVSSFQPPPCLFGLQTPGAGICRKFTREWAAVTPGRPAEIGTPPLGASPEQTAEVRCDEVENRADEWIFARRSEKTGGLADFSTAKCKTG